MHEFFEPWRRKLGITALVVACLFMMGWVRSLAFIEGVTIPIGIKRSASLVSNNSSLVCLIQRGDSFLMVPYLTSRRFSDIDDRVFENPLFQWHWTWCGFGFGDCIQGSKELGNQIIIFAPGNLVVVPFWSVVPPLTLLAAWLLLSKPRESKTESTAKAKA